MCTFKGFFYKIFLFFDVPQYSNRLDLIILTTDDEQFILTTKKSLHIIFKATEDNINITCICTIASTCSSNVLACPSNKNG